MSRGRRGKKKRVSGRSVVRLLEGLVCLLVLAGSILAFYRYVIVSDYFAVRQIRVEGVHMLNPEYVVQISEITTLDNIVFLNVTRIQERIEALPYVRACHVTRAFPDTVVIRVHEREAVATLLADNHLFEIDADCVVLRELKPAEPYTAPFITDVGGLGFVEPGQQLDDTPVKEALAAWTAFQQTPLAQEAVVSEIAATSESNIRMYFDDFPYEVRWGRGNFSQQAENFYELWAHLNRHIRCQEYLDLRFGNDLACK
jgi:cell division septal protein FtsQ